MGLAFAHQASTSHLAKRAILSSKKKPGAGRCLRLLRWPPAVCRAGSSSAGKGKGKQGAGSSREGAPFGDNPFANGANGGINGHEETLEVSLNHAFCP